MGDLGLLDDTLIVFTSDHGESFLEHGRTAHGHLYEHNLLVPLILRFPGRLDPRQRESAPVQLVDVLPTALELLGVPSPLDVEGESLVGLLRGEELPPRAAVAYDTRSGISAVVPDGTKVIVRVLAEDPAAGAFEVYDLNVDPREEQNLWSGMDVERRAELEGVLYESARPTCRARSSRSSRPSPSASRERYASTGPTLRCARSYVRSQWPRAGSPSRMTTSRVSRPARSSACAFMFIRAMERSS